jgi:sugar lactone lactonase YvrE
VTITATGNSASTPPKVDIAVSVTPGSVMQSVAIYRNDSYGRTLVRTQPSSGFDSRTVTDYECPYGEAVTYDWASEYIAPATPLFAETWASLASWTTSGASWSVSGGTVIWSAADSLVASITRAVTSGRYRAVFSAVPKGIKTIDFGGFQIDVQGAKLIVGARSQTFVPGTTTWTIDVTPTAVTLTTSAGTYSVQGVAAVTQVKFLGPVATYAFASKVSTGAGAGGVATDASGNVYITDYLNNRVRKYNSAGVLQLTFGSAGTGNGQFSGPGGIAIDSGGNIWVSDSNNNRVQKFNSSGTYLLQSGSLGSGNGQFNVPSGLAIDAADNLFVVDLSNRRVQKFNSSGTYQSQFGSSGTGNGQFSFGSGIAIDASGNIWATDAGRVQKFNSSGTYQSQFAVAGVQAIAIDSLGNLFLGFGSGAYRVQKYSQAGDLLQPIAPTGSGDGAVAYGVGVAIGASNSLWAVDGGDRLQRFTRTATSITPITLTAYGTLQSIAEPSAPVTLTPVAAWLVHPSTPTLSFPLQLSSDTLARKASIRSIDPISNPFNGTIHRIMGSGAGVATSNGVRDFDNTGMTISIHTAAEEEALRTLLADQVPILVNISPAKGVGFAYGFYQITDTLNERSGRHPTCRSGPTTCRWSRSIPRP